MPLREGYIYAIGIKGSPYVSVDARLKALQIAHHDELIPQAVVPVVGDVRQIEATIHHSLNNEHCRGEWFACEMDEATLQALVTRAICSIAADAGEIEIDDVQCMTLGQRVRWMRTHRGLTQKGLADCAGVHWNTIARLERDDMPKPSIELIAKIATALGIVIDGLFGPSDTIIK